MCSLLDDYGWGAAAIGEAIGIVISIIGNIVVIWVTMRIIAKHHIGVVTIIGEWKVRIGVHHMQGLVAIVIIGVHIK